MLKHTIFGSQHLPIPDRHKYMAKLDDSQIITTTWIMNRSIDANELEPVITEITAFCKSHGLLVTLDLQHHLKVTGKAINYDRALGTRLNLYQIVGTDVTFHASISNIQLPLHFAGKIEHILGFNSLPLARSYFHIRDDGEGQMGSRATNSSFTP